MARLTPSGRQAGFTYITVLIVVAIIGAGLAAVGSVWHTMVQRENEKALLYVGNEFRVAINQYFLANQRYPLRLDDLLRDEGKLIVKRYLRRVYFDPLTNRADWGLVKLANGQIVGIYSLSPLETLKKRNFRPRDEGFKDKQRYSEWLFLAEGQAVLAQPSSPNSKNDSPPFVTQALQSQSAPH